MSNSFKDQVPDTYIRKQTLVNGERFITQELKDLEHEILTASERVVALEYELFSALRQQIADNAGRIQKTAAAVAECDALCSFASVAVHNNFCRPEVDESGVIEIREGRHPVVEKVLKDSLFVPNDTFMGEKEDRVAIITGPNMAGKSTYMRQVALIVLMAQMGSFVPAASARIGVVDRIFTRIGASDDLSAGQSTFMVEMTEVSDILHQATKNSLLILDEIGRGTSTFDGMAIARAVLECIAFQVTDLMLAMRQDAGCDIACLRVDGGASVSDLLMQLQADGLRIPVDRPAMVETTAFGAAALAGLSCGVWSGLEELTRLRRSQRVFLPTRPQADCDRDYRLWKRAVSRASDWIEH